MAKVGIPEGKTIQTVTRTSVLEDSPQAKSNIPDIWAYLAGLTPEQRSQHVIYLYRLNPATGKYAGLTQYCDTFVDEWTIKNDFGGGIYKVMVKDGPQILNNTFFEIEGPSKSKSENPSAPDGASGEARTFAGEVLQLLREELRASRGGDLTNKAAEAALGIQAQGFTNAVQTIASTTAALHPNVPVPGASIMEKFMEAMVLKMANPTDPIETFGRMMAVMKDITPAAGPKSGIIETIISEGLRQLPASVGQIRLAADAYARAKEAEARTAEIMRGAPPRQISQPAAQAPPPPADTAPAPGFTLSTDPQRQGIEWIETGIAAILNEPHTAKQAAQRVLDFLDEFSTPMIAFLVSQGEAGILKMFQTEPILATIPQNPALSEFVKHFLEEAQDYLAEMQKAQPPAAPANGAPPENQPST